MQLQTDLRQPGSDSIPHETGLLFAAAVHHRVIAVPFEPDVREFLTQNPLWIPTLPSRTLGDFRMVDLLTFARVDPASRGQ